jgi:hypothetical protein
MARELDVRWETLNYTARYARPTFSLWGQGGKIVEGLYDALSRYGVTLENITGTPTLQNASAPLLTIAIGNSGTLKVAHDRLEFSFSNFTTDFFQSLPQLFSGCTQWLRGAVPKFQFATHQFHYFIHSYVKEATTEGVLKTINPMTLKSGGLSLGHGAIFNHLLPDRKWITQLIIDRSSFLPDALFVALNLTVSYDDIKYETLILEGREYLDSLLEGFDLSLPQFS